MSFLVPLMMKSSTERTQTKNKAVLLFGPTASGKTALTEALFSEGAEIVNADSVQVYRYLDIGSAKPDDKLRRLIPHHLVDIRNPWEQYTAGDFVRDAELCISDICSRGNIPVITGGTAYYFRQLAYGPSSAPPSDPVIRQEVERDIKQNGEDWAYNELERVDPVSASRINPNDIYRVSRALEVYRTCSRPLSLFPLSDTLRDDIDFVIIGLKRDKKELDERIRLRVDAMFDEGLYDEIKKLVRMGADESWPGMQGIGYREFLDAMVSGEVSLGIIKEDIIRATRQYAKRQMTFFSSFATCRFFHPDDIDSILEYLTIRDVRLRH